jgi:hypothetical protein
MLKPTFTGLFRKEIKLMENAANTARPSAWGLICTFKTRLAVTLTPIKNNAGLLRVKRRAADGTA